MASEIRFKHFQSTSGESRLVDRTKLDPNLCDILGDTYGFEEYDSTSLNDEVIAVDSMVDNFSFRCSVIALSLSAIAVHQTALLHIPVGLECLLWRSEERMSGTCYGVSESIEL